MEKLFKTLVNLQVNLKYPKMQSSLRVKNTHMHCSRWGDFSPTPSPTKTCISISAWQLVILKHKTKEKTVKHWGKSILKWLPV